MSTNNTGNQKFIITRTCNSLILVLKDLDVQWGFPKQMMGIHSKKVPTLDHLYLLTVSLPPSRHKSMNGLSPLETHYQLPHDSSHVASHFEELDKRYALLPMKCLGSHLWISKRPFQKKTTTKGIACLAGYQNVSKSISFGTYLVGI